MPALRRDLIGLITGKFEFIEGTLHERQEALRQELITRFKPNARPSSSSACPWRCSWRCPSPCRFSSTRADAGSRPVSVVPNPPSASSATAAANLWDRGSMSRAASKARWARSRCRIAGPVPKSLGWTPPELEAPSPRSTISRRRFCSAAAMRPWPMGVASLFGFELELPPVSAGAVIWRVTPDREPSLETASEPTASRDIPRAALAAFLGRERSTEDPIEVVETAARFVALAIRLAAAPALHHGPPPVRNWNCCWRSARRW